MTFDPDLTSFVVIKTKTRQTHLRNVCCYLKSCCLFIPENINNNPNITTLEDNTKNALDDLKPTLLPFIRLQELK